MKKISVKELAVFLGEANKSTYANKGAPKAVSTRLKSEDYHFEKGGLIYHDTYFRGRDFIINDIAYKNKSRSRVLIILVLFLMRMLEKKMFTISCVKFL